MELFSRNSRLENTAGSRVNLKGLNWFGFETPVVVAHGLWCRNLESILDWMKSQGFNALRIPFACDFALDLDGKQPVNPDGSGPAIDYKLNPALIGMSSGQVLDYIVNAAAARGVVIVFVMHHLYGTGGIDPLWYDEKTPESAVLRGWTNIAARYTQWNVVAADIKNEPHASITWGSGNTATDFDEFCSRAGNAIHRVNPKLLIFVEGLDKMGGAYSCWGESLQGAAAHPVQLNVKDKVVYSPHVYGQRVAGMPNSDEGNWKSRFGYIVADGLGPAVVIGEWGGDVEDYPFLFAFARWMSDNGITDNFHWSLNPDSGDTKGVLADDWVSPVAVKMDIVNGLVRNPTVFTASPPVPAPTPAPAPAPAPGAAAPASPAPAPAAWRRCSAWCPPHSAGWAEGQALRRLQGAKELARRAHGGQMPRRHAYESPLVPASRRRVACVRWHEVA